jgi:hypothetical protein
LPVLFADSALNRKAFLVPTVVCYTCHTIIDGLYVGSNGIEQYA